MTEERDLLQMTFRKHSRALVHCADFATVRALIISAALVIFNSTTPSWGAQSNANPPASAHAAEPGKTLSDKVNPEPTAAPPGYRIGSGDVLEIDVWKEREASVASIMVRPDGKITLPLIKEVDVLGLTPTELEKLLAGKLEQFIHGADVTVVVREVRSKRVYLVGAVNKGGPVPLLSNMTVLQVLAEAGGVTDYAKRKKIYILRKQNGKDVKIPFNYDSVIKGERMEENIPVLPDDTIVVPH
jgi:polysaccharide export outer membrane protein